jgi:hypothetical protein
MIDFTGIKPGDVFVFLKVDGKTNGFREYKVGDEMIFSEFSRFPSLLINQEVANFYVDGGRYIAHFGTGIFDYLEKKVVLERQKKLTELGIV